MSALDDVAPDLVVHHAPFGARTTYRVGGTARYLVNIENLTDLDRVSRAVQQMQLPVIVLGNGSNMLVADGELDVIVVVLGEGFTKLDWREERRSMGVRSGSALNLPVVARRLSDAGITGYEWAVGVPGTMGGAAVMNAGGHGSDMAHCVRAVTTWSFETHELEEWSLGRLNYKYRTSDIRSSDVVTGVTLQLRKGDPNRSRSLVREIVRWRREHQPGGSNAGSVFQNPPDGFAGELIERAGMKGRRLGSAQVSDKHANFIQLDPKGRSEDVYQLMSLVRDEVEIKFGIHLRSELRMIGFEGRWL